jgi:hypothetical protein
MARAKTVHGQYQTILWIDDLSVLLDMIEASLPRHHRSFGLAGTHLRADIRGTYSAQGVFARWPFMRESLRPQVLGMR